jgi:hypothetical protein
MKNWGQGQVRGEEGRIACGGAGKGREEQEVMERRRTALPTCYRILYYNADFPVAPSFTQTRKRDREREERLPQSRERKREHKRRRREMLISWQ